MKFANLLTAFYFQPWAIRPEVHQLLGRKLQEHMNKAALPSRSDLIEPGDDDDPQDDDREAAQSGLGVMVIPVHGIIGKHLGMMEMLCGGYDLDWLSADIDAAEADDSIHTVILDFDSPGGTTTGVDEMAQRICGLGKTTIAYTSTQCASAAYYLAAACGEIIAAPSAIVGSIGVYIAAVDSSRAWENEGFKLKLFRDGKLKAIGLEGKEWTADEDAFLQGVVDKVSAKFKGFVTAQRPGVSDDTMQGQWFSGEDALPAGLVDDLSPELQNVVIAAAAAGLLAD